MNTDVCPPGPPVCTTFKPGTVFSTSGTARYCWVAISLSVTTVTELATCATGVATPVGLTTRGDVVVGVPGTAATAGDGCGGLRAARRVRGIDCATGACVEPILDWGGGDTSTGGNRVGDADCWAFAAVNPAASTDKNETDVRKPARKRLATKA